MTIVSLRVDGTEVAHLTAPDDDPVLLQIGEQFLEVPEGDNFVGVHLNEGTVHAPGGDDEP